MIIHISPYESLRLTCTGFACTQYTSFKKTKQIMTPICHFLRALKSATPVSTAFTETHYLDYNVTKIEPMKQNISCQIETFKF